MGNSYKAYDYTSLMQEIKEAFTECGLDTNEITIYLVLLKKGPSSAQNVSKYASINRTTTYHILRRLSQKGFVSITQQNKVSKYYAEDPEKIPLMLENKKRMFESILPSLNTLKGSFKDKPKSTIFEGSQGIRSIFLDMLNTGTIIRHYGDASS